jgi:nitrogen regulatory protein P-II 1
MDLRKITAIIRSSELEKVEESLKNLGVKGISVSRVKGYGEYADFYKSDWMVTHARMEIFTEKSKVDEIVSAIMETAHLGIAGDGIVAVLPVERLFRIRTGTEVSSDEI